MNTLSMTGFGAASQPTDLGLLQIDIKSVNSRFFECNVRLPEECRSHEAPLRERLAKAVARGKIDLRLYLSRDQAPAPAAPSIREPLVKQLLAVSHQVQTLSNHTVESWRMVDLLRWPGVMVETPADPEAFAQAVTSCFEAALLAYQASRQREGEALGQTILDKVDQLEALCSQAAAQLPAALAAQTERVSTRLQEAFANVVETERQTLIEERIRQEANAAAIRSDVAEELDRLKAHLAEITRVVRSSKDNSLGKRLDFLTQECHREANTLGSKSPGLALTQTAMEMKLLIEQIKEQVQNIQ
jgi:uncharacterized protein (TIGR00255 family)